MSQLRLMSQNQWNCTNNLPCWEEQNLDCSSEMRMKGHTRVLRELMPDVVGGQEVNKDMQLDLMFGCLDGGLPYTLIWGNMTPILYRADKLELLDAAYRLYPEKAEGFEGTFNDARSKAANLGVFRCKENGKVFIFLTTHLWWKNGNNPSHDCYQAGSDQVRTQQISIAMDLVDKHQKKYGRCPVVFVGDLNTGYLSETIQYALRERCYSHAHDIATEYAHQGIGYNGCSPHGVGEWRDEPFEKAIDHILVRDFPKGAVRRFDRYTPDYYVYLSDHAPVYVDIEL